MKQKVDIWSALFEKLINQSNIRISAGSRLLRWLNVRFWTHSNGQHRFNTTLRTVEAIAVCSDYFYHMEALKFHVLILEDQSRWYIPYIFKWLKCILGKTTGVIFYTFPYMFGREQVINLYHVCVFFFFCSFLFKWRSNDLINSTTCNGLIHRFIS